MPLNNAVFEPGRNKIFGVSGGYIHRFNAVGFREASARFAMPDWADTYLVYSTADDKLYAAHWLIYTYDDGDGQRYLYRINPDTLAVETSWDQDSGVFDEGLGHYLGMGISNTFAPISGIRQMLCLEGLIYLLSDTDVFVIDPTDPASFLNPVYLGGIFRAIFGNLATDGNKLLVGCNSRTDVYAAPLGLDSTGINSSGVNALRIFGLTFSAHAQAVYTASAGPLIGKAKYPGCDGITIDLGEATANPFNIRTCPYNHYVYIPLWRANKVAILDPRDDSFVLVSGFDSPFDIVFTDARAFAVQHGPAGLKPIIASLATIPPYSPPETPAPAPTRLVAYYPFDETGTVARADATGKGANLLGPFSGAPNSTPALQGNAARFNAGLGLESTTFDFDLNLNNGFTVTFWFRPTNNVFAQHQPIYLTANSGCIWQINAQGFGLGMVLYVADGLGNSDSISSFALTLNAWHHFRFWVDPSDRKIRAQMNNGTVFVSTVALLKTDSSGGSTLLVNRGGSATFDEDELAIYEGALTDAEYAVLYGGGTPPAFPAVPYGPVSPAAIDSAETFGVATVTN